MRLWELAESWIEQSTKQGKLFSVLDLLIGAVGRFHKAELWTLDGDFKEMAGLLSCIR